jgi:hypothetical protein
MSKLIITVLVAAGLGIAANANAQYKIDPDACWSLSASAKEICIAQKKSTRSVAVADAHAGNQGYTDKLEAEYRLAIEECDAGWLSAMGSCVHNAKVRYGMH